jgi:hypothetical protein
VVLFSFEEGNKIRNQIKASIELPLFPLVLPFLFCCKVVKASTHFFQEIQKQTQVLIFKCVNAVCATFLNSHSL